MKTIDNETGQVINDGLGDTAQPSTPNATDVANFLGVPVKWVIIAGLVLLVLPALLERR